MKKILFVCVENSCRSQMAEGFANSLANGKLIAYSSGSRPSGQINPDAIYVMNEIGIDISRNQSKGFSELPEKKFDHVITMGCKDTCPFIPAESHIDWDIKDPKGRGIDFFREVREEIRKKVEKIIKDILPEE